MSKTAAARTQVRHGSSRSAWQSAPKARSTSGTVDCRENRGSRTTQSSWVAEVLRALSFPGFTNAPERLQAGVWWVANLLLAQMAFSWQLCVRFLTPGAAAGLEAHTGIALLYATLFVIFCSMEGLYRPSYLHNGSGPALRKTAIWSVLTTSSIAWLAGGSLGPQPVLIVASAWVHFALLAVLRMALQKVPKDAGRARRIVIVGTGRTAQRLASFLLARPGLEIQFEGFVDGQSSGSRPEDPQILGRVQELEQLARSHFLDEIIVCLPDEPAAARRAVFLARRLSVDVKVVPDVYGCIPKSPGIELAGDIPLLTLQEGDAHRLRELAKRGLDLAAAAGGLVLLAPALAAIALLVKLDSRGPAFYRAPRAGRRGREFRCYKFRTMQVDADFQKLALREKNERAGPFFKLKHDPRVTRVGRWLRRYSLDELPQLWNIVRGEMSLVGPRPHPLDDHARYAPEHFQRLAVTPGLTGLWQVTARNDPSFERNMALDREYIERQSLRMDLWILLRTVREVALGSGV